ncbi:hypothetical protein T03_11872 [Trichinella britovi]|uniref:Uncharacterized protein n=1 Tax=Trichinella britovi TaxID=45882 RepID=A0A0V1C4G3_TRIBR|nr:hypothetical protein T03_11872 [Trichinella britovi]
MKGFEIIRTGNTLIPSCTEFFELSKKINFIKLNILQAFYTCFSKVEWGLPQQSNNVPIANNPSKGLVRIDGRSSTSRESVVLVNGWRVINNKETLFHYGSLHVANYANEFFSIYVIWAILCLHELEPKCKALSPAWRDSDGSRNMYMLLP